jgi:hypothetical protein
MRIYIIGNDGITLCRKAPGAVNDGEIAVASNEELHAAPLSGKRLRALWNALPGVEKRKKVGDRDALIDQLWSAIEMLPDPEPQRVRYLAGLGVPQDLFFQAFEAALFPMAEQVAVQEAGIRCGESLLGVFDLDAVRLGIPDAAYKPLTGDDKVTAKYFEKRNKAERAGQGSLDFIAGGGRLPREAPLAEAARHAGRQPRGDCGEAPALRGRAG